MSKYDRYFKRQEEFNKYYDKFIDLMMGNIKNYKLIESLIINGTEDNNPIKILNSESDKIKFKNIMHFGRPIYHISFYEENVFYNPGSIYDRDDVRRESIFLNNLYKSKKSGIIDKEEYLRLEEIYITFNKRFKEKYNLNIEDLIIKLTEDYIDEDDIGDNCITKISSDYINSISEEELLQLYMIYEMKYGE